MLMKVTYPIAVSAYSGLTIVASVGAWMEGAVEPPPLIAMMASATVLASSLVLDEQPRRRAAMIGGLAALFVSSIVVGAAENDIRPTHLMVRAAASGLFALMYVGWERVRGDNAGLSRDDGPPRIAAGDART